MNRKAYGEEPTFRNFEIETQGELVSALNWYSLVRRTEHAREWLVEFAELFDKSKIEAILKTDDMKLNRTMGWIARLKMRGITLPLVTEYKFGDWFTGLPSFEKVEPITDNILYFKERINDHLISFEAALDAGDYTFSMYDELAKNKPTTANAKDLTDTVERLLEEVSAAVDGSDEQITEAYSTQKKTNLRKQLKWLQTVSDDISRFTDNKKAERKPRKARVKTTSSLLKHFRHLERHDPMQLVSVDPVTIIGADQLFTLNTTNNTLTKFVANDIKGLSVNRSSITNYNENLTQCKRVGKRAKEVIEAVLNGNKKQRETVFELVKADYGKVINRINNQTVVLKTVRAR